MNKFKNKILEDSKPLIGKYGWSEDTLRKINKNSNVEYNEIKILFSDGYLELLQYYLDQINFKMSEKSKKINLLRLKIHERIRELIILRLKVMSDEKKIISKTFFHLLLPQNFNLSLKNLYITCDQIWYLAGDQSTDFNFYSKRAILSSIYSITLLHFINNNNLEETIELLDIQLKKVSNIPKLKNRIDDLIKFTPEILKFRKNFSFFKQ